VLLTMITLSLERSQALTRRHSIEKRLINPLCESSRKRAEASRHFQRGGKATRATNRVLRGSEQD
jgi:hypothetical protein